ncbi:TPA: DUF4092 domain-containing protein [Escherichia coli]|nr:DUF4092 domain-containing protein [Escherichia coli]EHL6284947.1 DUF4092 domain-containing protein [Escherichia coli]EHL6334149.1 DUF4092 domain-containing protein [Escherichia coli]EJH0661879.1 DUF4092 domain-containing protein [Escherichia coli]EKK2896484.1 DUF4092 domain-containing protein [Escherichia coli]
MGIGYRLPNCKKFHVFHDSTNFYGRTGNARGEPRQPGGCKSGCGRI